MPTTTKNTKKESPTVKDSLTTEVSGRLELLTERQWKRFQKLVREIIDEQVTAEEQSPHVSAVFEILFPEGLEETGLWSEFATGDSKNAFDSYRSHVGYEIRKRRLKLGLTQSELARRIGIPQSHLSRLEVGKHTPTFLTMQRIADELGVAPSALDPGFSE